MILGDSIKILTGQFFIFILVWRYMTFKLGVFQLWQTSSRPAVPSGVIYHVVITVVVLSQAPDDVV